MGVTENTFRTAIKLLSQHGLLTYIVPTGADKLSHKPSKIIVEEPQDPDEIDKKGTSPLPETHPITDPLGDENLGFPPLKNSGVGTLGIQVPYIKETLLNKKSIMSGEAPDGGGDFEELWKAYPSRIMESGSKTKGSKGVALATYKALRHHKDKTKRPPSKEILLAIFAQMHQKDPKYIPDMNRWLAKTRWIDEEFSTIRPAKSQTKKFLQMTEKAAQILADYYKGIEVPVIYENGMEDGTVLEPFSQELVAKAAQSIQSMHDDLEGDWVVDYARWLTKKYNNRDRLLKGIGYDSQYWRTYRWHKTQEG
jgi:hypothetical protein